MVKTSDVLGLNSRTKLFTYSYNPAKGKRIANSKLRTKRLLAKAGIPVPQMYIRFKEHREVLAYNWESLPDAFALKPNRGLGGEGIIVVKRRAKLFKDSKIAGSSINRHTINSFPKAKDIWITTARKKVKIEDLKLHTLDILEGAFSMDSIPDLAYIEEYVGRHKTFKKFAYRGTPDIRIIVFNKVPVMAMLRLPTKESGGRANLHQGAIGVGIDITTGITTRAIWHGEHIKYKPGTKRKLHGIKIPQWTKILETAVNTQIASALGYVGVDIVLHPEKGPMVLEINAQPGLQIQLANMGGLRRRLDRVTDLEVRDAEHGVRIAKVLFAGRFADKVKAEEGIKTIKTLEKIKVYYYNSKKRKKEISARIDTGAFRSSIDRQLADDLGLLKEENILWKDRYQYRSATGLQDRPVIGLKFSIAGKKINSSASVTDRSKLTTKLLVGRNDLGGFLVNPEDSLK